ncbi:MAG: hypothetical protein PHH68_08325 [Candidatus Omnitrophica bacterium]|jgi:hypothetical protein|nr:hypothetical protein [Candidatus Omnitrophota bacterium]MDD5080305.1 hypothetical protein [Candidatus Omnitrophota bacterium]
MSDKKGRSFVTIMIIVALTALVLRFATERLINFNISQNEAYAQETLKLVSTAMENFANDHKGGFPKSLEALVEADPPYIDKVYVKLSYARGYNYSFIRFDPGGYTYSAIPWRCNLTGRNTYIITTGGTISLEECNKRE